MPSRLTVFLIVFLAELGASGSLRADDNGPVVERGAFVLHLFNKPTGRETDEVRRDGDDLVLTADYENTDRGMKERESAAGRPCHCAELWNSVGFQP